MNNTIDMMAKLLENNNIPLSYGARKKDGGLNYENKDRCHALVVGYSGSYSFMIDSGSSSNIDLVQDLFSTLHPCSGTSILMGDDS